MNLNRLQSAACCGQPTLNDLQAEFSRLFQLPYAAFSRLPGSVPSLDLAADKENLYVRVEMPGLKKEQFDISLHDGSLIISGERNSNTQGEDSIRSERFTGRFRRSVQLPNPVDAARVSASYKDGILTVTLPKTEESKPRQIEIKTN